MVGWSHKDGSLTFILRLLNPNLTADGRSYSNFKCSSLHLNLDSVFYFIHTALNLTEHVLPVWPMKIKCVIYAIANATI